MNNIQIPLKIISLNDDGFHLLVEIVVFEQNYWAVLDTGASRSVFDLNLLEQHLGVLTVQGEQQASTLFSTNETQTGLIPFWQIGDLKIEQYHAIGLDLSGVSETYAQLGHPPIAAIIGGDILMKHSALIDYKKNILFLSI